MKKVIYAFFIIIISTALLISLFYEKNVIVLENGIKYAINVDGKTSDSFPNKNLYTVNVQCENATGKWNYDNWKMIITKIKGNVSCKVDFNTISKNYLNNYLTNLVGTTQGDGQFVAESESVNPGYDDISNLTKEEYGAIEMFTSSSVWDESGETITNVFEFSDGKWHNMPSNMTGSSVKYHIKFVPSSSGYYQFCYEMPTVVGENIYIVTSNRKTTFSVYSSNDEKLTSCINLNYISEGEYVMMSDGNYNNTFSNVNFYLKKANNPEFGDKILRYEGTNPYNYILFNNERWRIIGVFDELAHGQPDKKLVKIVRNESIGELLWNKSGESSDWNNSLINKILNENYYNSTNGTLSGNCLSYYGYDSQGYISTYENGFCDYSFTGIKDGYRKMISQSIWYNGGRSDSDNAFDIIASEKVNPSSGYIGLMYFSDYKFGNLATDECSRDSSISNACIPKNWIRTFSRAFLLTKSLYSVEQLVVGTNSTQYVSSVYPTVYLNENVYVLDGDGSYNDPYIIAMDEV